MSVRLKVLALASAAALALPAASYAAPSLSLVEYDVGEWTMSATGFATFLFNGSSATPQSFVGPGTATFTGTGATGAATSGQEYVVTSTSNAVVAQLNWNLYGAGTLTGSLQVGGTFTPANESSTFIYQGASTLFTGAVGNATLSLDTEGVPEPASLMLLGSGLLGLGGIAHRRRAKPVRSGHCRNSLQSAPIDADHTGS